MSSSSPRLAAGCTPMLLVGFEGLGWVGICLAIGEDSKAGDAENCVCAHVCVGVRGMRGSARVRAC